MERLDDKILALGAVVEIGTAARVNWEEVAPLLPHRAAGELRKQWAKISESMARDIIDQKRPALTSLKELRTPKGSEIRSRSWPGFVVGSWRRRRCGTPTVVLEL